MFIFICARISYRSLSYSVLMSVSMLQVSTYFPYIFFPHTVHYFDFKSLTLYSLQGFQNKSIIKIRTKIH